MLIPNTWLEGLIFAAAVTARVAPDHHRRNSCHTDSCSKALLNNLNAATLFCQSLQNNHHQKLARGLQQTCSPTFLPYPDFAAPCFENGQDLNKVEAACDCVSSKSSGSSSGSGQSSGGEQQNGSSGGSSGAGNNFPAPIQSVVTTDIVYTTITVSAVTSTVGSGPTSTVHVTDSTLTLTQTTTLTVCNKCAVATNPNTVTEYVTATSPAGNAAVTKTSIVPKPGKIIPVQSHPVYLNSTGSLGNSSQYPTGSGVTGHSNPTSGLQATMSGKGQPSSATRGNPTLPFPLSRTGHPTTGSASPSGVSMTPAFPVGVKTSSGYPSKSGSAHPSYSASGGSPKPAPSGSGGSLSNTQSGTGSADLQSSSIATERTNAPYPTTASGSPFQGTSSGMIPQSEHQSPISARSSVGPSGYSPSNSIYVSGSVTSSSPFYPSSGASNSWSTFPSGAGSKTSPSSGVEYSRSTRPSTSGSQGYQSKSGAVNATSRSPSSTRLTITYPFGSASSAASKPLLTGHFSSNSIYAFSSLTGSSPFYPSSGASSPWSSLHSGTGSKSFNPSSKTGVFGSGTGVVYPSNTGSHSANPSSETGKYPTGTGKTYQPSGSSSSSKPSYPSGSAQSRPSSGTSYSSPSLTGSGPMHTAGTTYSKPLSGTSYSRPSLTGSGSIPTVGTAYSKPSSGTGYSKPSSWTGYSTPHNATSAYHPTSGSPSSSTSPPSTSSMSGCSPSADGPFILQAEGTGTDYDGTYISLRESDDIDNDGILFFANADPGYASTFSIEPEMNALITVFGRNPEVIGNIHNGEDSIYRFDTPSQLAANFEGHTTEHVACDASTGTLQCRNYDLNILLFFFYCDGIDAIQASGDIPTDPSCHLLTFNVQPTGSAGSCVSSSAGLSAATLSPSSTSVSSTVGESATSALASVTSAVASPVSSACTDASGFKLQLSGAGAVAQGLDGQYLQISTLSGTLDDSTYYGSLSDSTTFDLAGALLTTLGGSKAGSTEIANVDYEETDPTVLRFDTTDVLAMRPDEGTQELICRITDDALSCSLGDSDLTFYSCLTTSHVQFSANPPATEYNCQALVLNVIAADGSAFDGCVGSPSVIPTSILPSVTVSASTTAAPLSSQCPFHIEVTGANLVSVPVHLANGGGDDHLLIQTGSQTPAIFSVDGAGHLTSDDGSQGTTEFANLYFGTDNQALEFDKPSLIDNPATDESICQITSANELICATGDNTLFYFCPDDTSFPAVYIGVTGNTPEGCSEVTLSVTPSDASCASFSTPPSGTVPPVITSAVASITPVATYTAVAPADTPTAFQLHASSNLFNQPAILGLSPDGTDGSDEFHFLGGGGTYFGLDEGRLITTQGSMGFEVAYIQGGDGDPTVFKMHPQNDESDIPTTCALVGQELQCASAASTMFSLCTDRDTSALRLRLGTMVPDDCEVITLTIFNPQY